MTFLNKTRWKTTKRPGGQWLNMQESDRPAHTEGVMLGMLHQFPMEQAGAWVSDRTGEVLAKDGIPSLAGHCSANTCWMNRLGKNSPVRCSCPWILNTGAILMAVLFQRWDCWVVWVWVWICTDLCVHSVGASGWHRRSPGRHVPSLSLLWLWAWNPSLAPTHTASLSQTCVGHHRGAGEGSWTAGPCSFGGCRGGGVSGSGCWAGNSSWALVFGGFLRPAPGESLPSAQWHPSFLLQKVPQWFQWTKLIFAYCWFPLCSILYQNLLKVSCGVTKVVLDQANKCHEKSHG